MDKEEAKKVVKSMQISNYLAEIGSRGGRAHRQADPDYFKKLGARGGKKFKELMQDEDYRAEHRRRSRLGSQFGVKQNGG